MCERLEVGVTTLFAIFGEAEDHDMGVVVFVDALHGLDEVVNSVEDFTGHMRSPWTKPTISAGTSATVWSQKDN